jgi:hypothetical protein
MVPRVLLSCSPQFLHLRVWPVAAAVAILCGDISGLPADPIDTLEEENLLLKYSAGGRTIMPEAQDTILIQAKPESVWEVLVDPYYTPKLFPDVLNIIAEPPGRSIVGQKRTSEVRLGKRLIQYRTQVTELIPLKRFVLTGLRGGAFDVFSQIVELAPAKEGTQVRVVFFFKLSKDYFEPGFDFMVLTLAASRNQDLYLKNLKELSELRPVG